MNMIVVEDKEPVLYMVKKAVGEAAPEASVEGFKSAREALAYAKKNKVDVAFLDIEMPEMNGLVLAKHLKELWDKTNIVFVTGYSEYAIKAFSLPASGYLMKPIDASMVSAELERLRYPVEPDVSAAVHIKCFGSFAVLVDGKPLLISQRRPKELLAYLVHKQGSGATTAEIAALFWGDRSYDNTTRAHVRKIISRLMDVLKQAGIADIICRAHNSIAVDVSRFTCDSYQYLNGDIDSINSYAGEYMSEYSWAEFTAAYLTSKMK
ncbi:MAG: response regulator [Raoultibacter sp.]|jgi:two-component system LytT family response regulator